MMTKVEIDIEPRRASSGPGSLSKSKSTSMHSLTLEDEELEIAPRWTNKKPRSKWAKSNLSTFASVPNLLQPDDNGLVPFKYFDDSSSVDTVNTDPDINDNVIKDPKLSSRRSSQASGKSEGGSLASSRLSSSTSRLNSDSSGKESGGEEKKKMARSKVSVSASNLQSVDKPKKTKDRDLMPPPAVRGGVKTARQEHFAKRANDARRKTMDNSGFSLEEAKDILTGKSVKISEIKENARKKRSTSTSPNRAHGNVVLQTKDPGDMLPFIDPGVLDAAKEIEMTATELRRKSAPSNAVSMEASPNDPPERDVPNSAADMPRTRSRSAKRAPVNTTVVSNSQPVLNNSENSDTSRDSGLSTQEEDECLSHSVKDRIRQLNKQVTDTDRQASASPSRAGGRPGSPSRETAQFSFPSSSTITTVTTTNSSIEPANLATTTICSNSSATVNNTSNSPLASQHRTDHQAEITSTPLTPGTMTISTQSLSPPSGLGASMDSETLANNLSPGNMSNSSPRSMADTGLGSDTDLETRYSLQQLLSTYNCEE